LSDVEAQKLMHLYAMPDLIVGSCESHAKSPIISPAVGTFRTVTKSGLFCQP